jgi:hypothetical protein
MFGGKSFAISQNSFIVIMKSNETIREPVEKAGTFVHSTFRGVLGIFSY